MTPRSIDGSPRVDRWPSANGVAMTQPFLAIKATNWQGACGAATMDGGCSNNLSTTCPGTTLGPSPTARPWPGAFLFSFGQIRWENDHSCLCLYSANKQSPVMRLRRGPGFGQIR